MSIIPFDVLTISSHSEGAAGNRLIRMSRLSKLQRFTKLFKLLRLFRVKGQQRKVQEMSNIISPGTELLI